LENVDEVGAIPLARIGSIAGASETRPRATRALAPANALIALP
jgi:hypothetical protein